ncbi:Zinc finger, CCHC-type [Phaffia rhodozyma]|uniref:Zinc finger, CCHC-type n=1 Tax=Phaffia rhodozyma TaxID=264483 RepID=A0A0F7SSX7_PHARH|nr:Zinc finger, CCHC-type [Phaffia rhodozyma]
MTASGDQKALIEMNAENAKLQSEVTSLRLRLQQSEARYLQTLQTTCAAPEPKIPAPTLFDGKDPRACRTFLTCCRMNFDMYLEHFSSEKKKLYFAISHLRGPPLNTITPSLERWDDDDKPERIRSFEGFAKFLNDTFGVPDEIQTASRELRALMQTGTAAEYYELKNLVLRIDNQLSQFEREDATRAKHSAPVNPILRSVPRLPLQPVSMENPTSTDVEAIRTSRHPISSRERERRQQLNLCHHCGRPDHILVDCPLRSRDLR